MLFRSNRWIGFGIVWLALIVLTIDTLRAARSLRREPPPPHSLSPEAA